MVKVDRDIFGLLKSGWLDQNHIYFTINALKLILVV